MSRLFYTPINLNNLELQNAVIGNLSTSSINSISSPAAGRVQYDSTLNVMKYYTGSAWVTVADTNDTITLGGTSVAIGGTTGVSGTRISNLYVNGADFTGTVTVPTPTNGTDAANKTYVDNAVVGIDWKASVRAATTASGNLTIDFANGSVVDGVTLATGDRVLIKDQSTGSQNGIYVVASSGPPNRATDVDTAAELTASFAVFVEEGTANADSGWVLTNNGTITVGTTALTFTQFTGLGQVTAGAGLTKSGNTLDVGAGTGITVNANDVAVNYSALWIGSSNVQNATGSQALTGISGITGIAGSTSFALGAPTFSSSTTSNEITITGGTNSNSTLGARGGAITITGGAGTNGTNGLGGVVTIKGGAGSGSADGGGGDIVIEGGTSSIAPGTISISSDYSGPGTSKATTIKLGNSTTVKTINIGGVSTDTTIITGVVKLPTVGTSGFVKLGSGGQLSADTTTYATKASGTISLTGGSAGTITHNLNSRAVLVQMFESSSSLPTNLVEMDVTSATVNTVTVTSAVTGTFYYVVIG